jgi:hypothetical protein
MQCIDQDNQAAQWYYRLRYLKCTYNPSLVGVEDEYFEPESRLVADYAVIEN